MNFSLVDNLIGQYKIKLNKAYIKINRSLFNNYIVWSLCDADVYFFDGSYFDLSPEFTLKIYVIQNVSLLQSIFENKLTKYEKIKRFKRSYGKLYI